MKKVKFFRKDTQTDLENEVNDFIKDKEITSISYAVYLIGRYVNHFCCVIYID